MWMCHKCKGRDFQIFHFTDMESMDKVRFICSKCGEEFFCHGNDVPLAITKWEDKMGKKLAEMEKEQLYEFKNLLTSRDENENESIIKSEMSETTELNSLIGLTEFLYGVENGKKKKAVKDMFPDIVFRRLLIILLDKYKIETTMTHADLLKLITEVYPNLKDPENIKNWFTYRLKNEENGMLIDKYELVKGSRKHVGYKFKPRLSILDIKYAGTR